MAPSTIDLSTIAARAASIYERAAAASGRRIAAHASEPDPAAAEAVHTWSRAFSPGDPEAFLKRLSWDDLDLPAVLDAASDPPGEAADRSWTHWLDRASRQARAIALDVRAGRFVSDPGLHVPFEEIWTAFRRAATEAIHPIVPDVAFERQLCQELSRQGELALFEQFREEQYGAFVSRLLDDGLAPFFGEYPALARSLASLTADWVDATREFVARLRDDRDLISTTVGADPGAVVSLEPGLSDPHHGRRRVALVRFQNGLQLVYKPRTVQLERAFNEFLVWMNAHLTVPLRTLKVIDRGTYGWVEFAAHDPADDRAAVARHFRRSGSLLAIAHLLGAQDLHLENVVVTRDGPVLVDTEMLLQPGADTKRSVLATGMVSLITVTDHGAVYDSGGLRGQVTGPLPFPHRVWHNLRTDALGYDEEPMYRSSGRHQIVLDGDVQDPSVHVEDVVQGFEEAYRGITDHRAELSAQDGPLQAFATASARVTLRPTNQYAMLSMVLTAPRYQRSGVARSTAVDVLHRAVAGEVQRPALWPAAVAERKAIARLDVPYFSVKCDGTDLISNGEVIVANHFASSGLASARLRLDRLSDRDLTVQVGVLRRALSESCATRFSTPPAAAADRRADAIAYAIWIARELLSRSDSVADGLVWRYRVAAGDADLSPHQLYDGTLGPVLLFAGLSASTGETTWRDQARKALVPLRLAIESGQLFTSSDRLNIGGADGLGSIVYGLTEAGVLLGDRDIIALASKVSGSLAECVSADESLDVIDGAAGAALGLLALFAITDDPHVLRTAIRCGDHLIDRGVPLDDDAVAWPSSTGARLVGFAHGASGIVCALARLFRATGERRFHHAAARGLRFVERQFVDRASNYPIAAAEDANGSRGAMLAWCHGAPGIVQALCRELDIFPKTAILSQLDAAIRLVVRDEPAQVDHLCCGAFGRVDAVLAAARSWRRADLEDAAWQLATNVTRRAVGRGHFRLSGAGVEYRVYDPGFFRGLSGIGYQWLRLADPALPSIAGFEAVDRHETST